MYKDVEWSCLRTSVFKSWQESSIKNRETTIQPSISNLNYEYERILIGNKHTI